MTSPANNTFDALIPPRRPSVSATGTGTFGRGPAVLRSRHTPGRVGPTNDKHAARTAYAVDGAATRLASQGGSTKSGGTSRHPGARVKVNEARAGTTTGLAISRPVDTNNERTSLMKASHYARSHYPHTRMPQFGESAHARYHDRASGRNNP